MLVVPKLGCEIERRLRFKFWYILVSKL